MNRRHRRSRNPLRVEALAGWIFADLLLVLFIVGLGSQASLVSAEEPEPEPTRTEQPEPPPEPEAPGMQQNAEIRTITVDAAALLGGSPEAQAAVDAQIRLATADLAGRQAGMTLIWGYSSDVSRGQAIAEAVGNRLTAAAPRLFDGNASKYLWFGSPEGTVDIEIYLFNQ